MTVDLNGLPSEGFESLDVGSESFVLEGSETGLSESVNINEAGEVVKFIVVSEMSSFPNGAFNGFTVSDDTVVSVVDLINVLGGVSHTSSNGETLTKRSSSGIDEVELGSWVTFEGRIDLSQGQDLVSGDVAVSIPAGIEDWGSMSLGQDQSVTGEVLGVVGVVMKTVGGEMEGSEDFSS